MSRIKYYYDPESLSYKEIKVTNINNFKLYVIYFFSFLFGVVSLLIILNTDIINTPTEINQNRELTNYKIQFDILNKKLNQVESTFQI